MNLGKSLIHVRAKRKLSQMAAAKKIGISQQYLSSLEAGNKEPSLTSMKKIARAYSVPMEVLIFMGTEEKDVPKNKREAYRLLAPLMNNLIENEILK